jgi:hypothetical protein
MGHYFIMCVKIDQSIIVAKKRLWKLFYTNHYAVII